MSQITSWDEFPTVEYVKGVYRQTVSGEKVMMTRIVRHYGNAEDAAALASGYHDPVTDRFVQATALVRKKRQVPDTCFERTPADVAPLEPRKKGRELMLSP